MSYFVVASGFNIEGSFAFQARAWSATSLYILARLSLTMLLRFWNAFFSLRGSAQADALKSLRTNMRALVFPDGGVRWVRECYVCPWDVKEGSRRDLSICFRMLSGETFSRVIHEDPGMSLEYLVECAACGYDVVCIGDINVLHPGILRICFEDLADENYHLEVSVCKACTSSRHKRSRRCDAPSTLTKKFAWERIGKAYSAALESHITLPAELSTDTPLKLSDVMAMSEDLVMRHTHALFAPTPNDAVITTEWIMVRVEDPVQSLSSGSTTRWKLLRSLHSQDPATRVCLISKGHDSNAASFALQLVQMKV